MIQDEYRIRSCVFQEQFWRLWNRLVVSHGTLCRPIINGDPEAEHLQFAVFSYLSRPIFMYFHDVSTGVHFVAEKTLDKTRILLYWPSMKKDIDEYCSQHDLFTAKKPLKASIRDSLHQYFVHEPVVRIAVDNKYILVICHYYNK
ncbi:hypothetical protein MHBO_004921 [Bonamia ostreae]|uniref:Integrase zinc-binding domain-containing protein n=1 Tax=Bonamia ostreae TaxID=126728 RepID=A0ABV2AUM1_9EUKA